MLLYSRHGRLHCVEHKQNGAIELGLCRVLLGVAGSVVEVLVTIPATIFSLGSHPTQVLGRTLLNSLPPFTPYTRPWSIYFSRIRTLPNSLTHSLKSYPILSLPHLFLLEVIPYTEDDDDDDQEDQDDDDGN